MSNITYTWKVTGVKTRTEEGQPGFVFQTYWTKTGVDENGNEGTFTGATPLKPGESTDFTPFEQLTEPQVLGWIQEVVVGDYEKHVNEQIAKQIALKANPVEEPTLPWAPPAETPAGTEPAI